MTDLEERTNRFMIRATAHALAEPRSAQRWQNRVTDLDVAGVLFAIEAEGIQPNRIKSGRWVSGRNLIVTTHDLSTVISEMIRTGLLRHLMDRGPAGTEHHLIPARVHLKDGQWSACRFTGEDLGPMRARLVDDLALVDCLECEQAVARGHARGL
jgi:hypothetical protein